MKRKFLGAAALAMIVGGAHGAMAQIYLRLDGGGALSRDSNFIDSDPTAPNSSFGSTAFRGSFGNSAMFGAGIGYRLSPPFRIDVTGSYLPQLSFSGPVSTGTGAIGTAKVRPLVGLLNGYLDFAGLAGLSYLPFQPFLVGSVGASRNKMSAFAVNGTEFINGAAHYDFAWGLGAGVTIPMGHYFAFDLTYKYLDLGKARSSGTLSDGMAATAIEAAIKAHTVTASLRLSF